MVGTGGEQGEHAASGIAHGYIRPMDRARTIATFVAGVIVGGGAVYLSPPQSGQAAMGAPGMMGQQPGMMGGAPGGQGGMPGQGGQGIPGQGAQGMPGQGAQGAPGQGMPGQGGPSGQAPAGNGAQPAVPTPGEVGVNLGVTPQSGATPGGSAEGALAVPDGPPDPSQSPSVPPGTTQQSGSRLEKHLRAAGTNWLDLADKARASNTTAVRDLAPDIEAHAASVPAIGEHMPPMQDVAGYLASSRVLLDRLDRAGMDVAELSLTIDMLMRPPRGKIPGGEKGAGTAAGP
jgi:hypothetical protein